MYRRLMIVVDDDPASRAAVAEGLDLAKALGAEVLFFHVLPSPTVPVIAGDMLPLGTLDLKAQDRQLQEWGGRILAEAATLAKAQAVPSRGVMGHSDEAATSIARAVEEQHCDLIVVGSHGRTALQRLIHGSLPASLLPLAPVPMLVCRVRDRPAATD